MRRNRVTPLGELIADPARGLVYGNRGCLHDAGEGGADAIDARLHAERLAPGGRERRLHDAALGDLPDGAFVLREGLPWLVLGPDLLRWSPAGYTERSPRPARGRVSLLTPPALLEWLRAGGEPLVPRFHPSAFSRRPLRRLSRGRTGRGRSS